MTKIAFITGATSGIGKASAELFAEHGIDLIICGRRKERLDNLKKKLEDKVKVHTLCFDVADKTGVLKSVESLPVEWKNIDILVNNAGNAHGLDFAQDADLNDWENMININVKGVMYVTKAVLPCMIENKSGHIVNISSIAGKEVYPKGNMYCASKHALDAFNAGLRMDLMGTGVKVSLVNPGLVNTEFSTVRFKGDKERADKVYEGFDALTAEDIADLIYYVISRPPHVNISDAMILPTAQVSAGLIYKEDQNSGD